MRGAALPLMALALAGCAGQAAYLEGNSLIEKDQVEASLLKYREAIDAKPENPVYRAAYLRARDRAATRLLDQAERNLGAGKAALALQDYQRVLAFEPANERARAGLRLIEMDERHTKAMEEASAAFERKEYEVARARAAAILIERPQYEPARQLLLQVAEKTAAPVAETGLAAAYKTPISIEFRDAPLKQVLDVIARRSNLNFIFDKDVKTDQKTSIFLKNSTVEAAIYYLMVSNQLDYQVMDGNTLLVYQNVASKLKEYQEMTVKTFFLANAEAKVVANTLKTILKSRDVVIDEKLNLVIVRDNPEAIKLAAKLVALQDVAEPEVMLEVEILEIKRSRLLELGVAWPTSVTLAPLVGSNGGQLTLDTVRGLGRADIGLSSLSASVTAKKTDGDSNTLANPRIRVRNKEKAKIVIGEKIPNITTTLGAGGVGGGLSQESITYLDVGLTLNVEPTIYLNNEIGIRVGLTVSSLGEAVTTASGNIAYRIGNREASTLLQLKDGENQVLAGLINNEDRSNGTKIPGLGNLPIVGRLFGRTADGADRSEIVLSITPHLIRNLQRPPASASEFSAGTETSFRRRPDSAARAPVVMPPPPGARAPVPVPVPVPVPAAPEAPGAAVTPIPVPETTPVPQQ
ncbi:secretin N-terminal domain-containing protein [Massilia violaceinigra]|uniref:secretin N-terminal domain-containing protein n=1 Tax=Massilia violaceinigra TaxID=2045208 RepID=UPI0027D7BC93|nr:secretin N-terminal domain-containing protein [Massilia violaceinigra]